MAIASMRTGNWGPWKGFGRAKVTRKKDLRMLVWVSEMPGIGVRSESEESGPLNAFFWGSNKCLG